MLSPTQDVLSNSKEETACLSNQVWRNVSPPLPRRVRYGGGAVMRCGACGAQRVLRAEPRKTAREERSAQTSPQQAARYWCFAPAFCRGAVYA